MAVRVVKGKIKCKEWRKMKANDRWREFVEKDDLKELWRVHFERLLNTNECDEEKDLEGIDKRRKRFNDEKNKEG